jgi:uncharacterized protein (TIGR03118 family)
MLTRILSLFAFAALSVSAATIDGFSQTNLVSSVPGLAQNTDPSLQNPWGMTFTPTSPFWAADNAANLSTLYSGAGVKQGLVVTVPGNPTGAVFNAANATGAFNGDLFIFATLSNSQMLDGTIEGWRGALGTTAETLFNGSAGAHFTGLAIGSIGANEYLYAADFGLGQVDVFGSTGAPPLAGTFTDPNIPAGFAPFGIETIGTQVFVAYAKVDPATGDDQAGPGNGFVSVFNLDGTFVRRAVTQGALNSPWGLAIAPAGFGTLGGDLLVGNFGDGTINVFNSSGNLIGTLATLSGNAIVNDGLWAIKFGNNGAGVNPLSLYINAGINDEMDGLFARIDAVPEPGTIALFLFGAAALCARDRMKRFRVRRNP